MAKQHDTPARLAQAFGRLATEFERISEHQYETPGDVTEIMRIAVRAGRKAMRASEAGTIPSLARAVFELGDHSARERDGLAVQFWRHCVVPWLAESFPDDVNSDASSWDFPSVKTDGRGRGLTAEGKPARVRVIDADGSVLRTIEGPVSPRDCPNGERLELEPRATVYDDKTPERKGQHCRMVALNYANACHLLAELCVDKRPHEVRRDRTGRSVDPPEVKDWLSATLDDLDAMVPPLEVRSKDWVTVREAARTEGHPSTDTLARYRRDKKAREKPDGSLGIDPYGRIYRRREGSTPRSHVFYRRPSLVKVRRG